MAKKSFVVKTPVNHNNKPYAPGSTIALEVDEAEPLLAVGAIEPAAEEPAPKEPVKK